MITRILNIVRGIIQDFGESYTQPYTYLSSKIFKLSEENIIAISNVEVNGVVLAPANYTFSAVTNEVTITSTLIANSLIEITATFYSKYSDTAIKNMIPAALSYLATYAHKVFYWNSSVPEFYPTPTQQEEYLIGMVVGIILKPNFTIYKTLNVTLQYPGTMSIEDKIKDVVAKYKKSIGIFFIG